MDHQQHQELAQQLALGGATLVLLGMPPGTEFGIDLKSWNVGERFRGVKMIPPGLHFVYFSAVSRQGDTAPRTGFFHIFGAREVLVRHYDPAAEDLTTQEASEEEVERIRSNLREMDRFLGPYPLDLWQKWIALTQHVEERDLARVVPLSGRVCSAAELIPVAPFVSSKSARQTTTTTTTTTDTTTTTTSSPDSTTTDTTTTTTDTPTPTDTDTPTPPTPSPRTAPQLPEMVFKEGTEFRYSSAPKRSYRDGADPSEVTRYSLDSSYSIRHRIQQLDRPESLLAEFQVAFVSFLVGQVWGGWEHWRILIGELCRAEEVLVELPNLYVKLLSALHYQVNEIPEDLFVDIVEANNFLAAALATLFANVNDNAAALPPALALKARRFKQHITAKFGWDLSLEDEGEDAPVVVEV